MVNVIILVLAFAAILCTLRSKELREDRSTNSGFSLLLALGIFCRF